MRASEVVGLGLVASLTVLSVLEGTACTPGEVHYGTGGTTSTSSGGGGGASGQGGAGGSGSGGTYGGVTIVPPDAGSFGGAGGTSSSPPPTWPPTGFVNVTNVTYGAYATDPIQLSSAGGASGQGGSSGGSSGSSQCAGLFGVVRDFKMGNLSGGHPDFQLPTPRNTAETGIVTNTLGDDGKPVYANPPAGGTTSTQANFDQWYRDVDGVNIPFVVGLHFVANPSAGNGVVTFAASLGTSTGTGRNRDAGAPAVATSSYFPVDGLGWNDTARADDGNQHNFAFTTEIHTAFIYNGGEKFTFQGDDDIWVYINKKLAIDLGGIHQQLQATVDLDAQASTLGISKGNTYDLAVFNAERHTSQSNFRIDTTLVFIDCGQIPITIY
jgi:fibro-slime domain-containing protein